MQAAGDLVAAALAELAAGVQDGEHDLEGGLVLLLHLRDRDAAAVVDDRDRVVRVDRHRDRVAVAGERLVHRVVHDLVDEVVQPADAGRADVHARTLADGLEALEDRDVLGVVARLAAVRSLGRRCSRVPFVHTSDAPAGRASSEAGAWPIDAVDISRRGFQIRTRARSESRCKCQEFRSRVACGPQAPHAGAAERRVQARDDELGHQVELVREDRAVARDGDDAVALGDGLRRRARTRRGVRPRPLDGREQRRRLERVGERVEREADRPRACASRRLVLGAARAPGEPPATRALPGELLAHAPSSIAIRVDVGLLRARHVRELGGGDHGLAVAAQQRRQALAAGARRARTSRRRAAAAERRRARRPAPRARRAAARAARGAAGRASRRRAARGPRGGRRGRRGAGRGR